MRPIYSLKSIVLAAFSIGTASPVSAQQLPTLVLDTGVRLEATEFSRISGVRELADGSVIVADALEKRLSVVDFQKQTSVIIGRVGDGPGEYRSLSRLIAMGGDTTYLVDMLGGRWLALAGSSFVGVLTDNDPIIKNGSRNPLGLDRVGHILFTRPVRSLESARGAISTGLADSSWLVLGDRRSGVVDTIDKAGLRPSRIAITGGKEVQSVSITTNPLAVGDQSVIFPDGTIAIARVNPYRVDWYQMKGRRLVGSALPFTGIPVTNEEKLASLQRLSRVDGKAVPDPESIADWPATIPPFLTGAVLPAPDGRLWIRRAPTAKEPRTLYDVVDRAGKLTARLNLPPNEVVAAFGVSHVYVVATDDDGLQHLRRHKIPEQTR